MHLLNPDKLWSELLEKSPHLALSPPGVAYVAFVQSLHKMEDQQFFEALELLDESARLLPDNRLPRWHCAVGYHKSLCALSLGDYEFGFRYLAFRKVFNPHAGDRINLAEWHGEPIAGKKLLVYQDMGFGDVLMMLRYVPILKEMGATVTLLIHEALHPLAKQLGCALVGELIDGKGYDLKIPLFGIMHALRQTADTIPGKPYLRAPAPLNLPEGAKQRVGLAWSGNPKFAKDNIRSISLEWFLDLFDHHRFDLYALQTGDLEAAAARGIKNFGLKDFADTANVMAAMDHVVCVDTAPIHVAGAIGHPSAHVMLPLAQEWRWYRGKAWYPNINMYRQKIAGDWSYPFALLNNALEMKQGQAAA